MQFTAKLLPDLWIGVLGRMWDGLYQVGEMGGLFYERVIGANRMGAEGYGI